MIRIENLSVSYGTYQALKNIALSARPGEVLSLIGANGSGKSSLLKAIAGLIDSKGSITLPQREGRAPRFGYMPQDIGAKAVLSVVETVLLGRLERLGRRVGADDLSAVSAALERLGITHLAGRALGELSGGQRQLVFLAQALVGEPDILLLDEPISALDIRNQFEVMETVRTLTHERGLVTLAVLHDLNIAARFSDQLAILHAGQLLAHAPTREALTAANLSRAFGVEAAIGEGAQGHLLVEPLRSLPREEMTALT